jgi:chromosomal replication initiation ATPase DnaA
MLCRDDTLQASAKCRLVQSVVEHVFAVGMRDLRAGARCCEPIARARQAMMYLTHVGLGVNLTKVARSFGRDRTTARYACRVMEDARDDPKVDQRFTTLEAALQTFWHELHQDI